MASEEHSTMVNTRIGLAVLGASCLAAAGTGGYFAARNNTAVPQAAISAPAESGSQAQAIKPVQETEAVMDEPVAAAPTTPTPDTSHPSQKPASSAVERRVPAREIPATPAPRATASRQTTPAPAPARVQTPPLPVR